MRVLNTGKQAVITCADRSTYPAEKCCAPNNPPFYPYLHESMNNSKLSIVPPPKNIFTVTQTRDSNSFGRDVVRPDSRDIVVNCVQELADHGRGELEAED